MTASDFDQVRENLIIEGLMDAISLGNVHTAFMYDNYSPKRPLHEAQVLTLDMIRELVREGLFVLGVPTRQGGFDAWDLPLDVAMAKIEDAYVKNFDDRWGWTTMVWMDQTEKGKKLALELYHADDPDHSSHQTP
jgi:hypothetical protein